VKEPFVLPAAFLLICAAGGALLGGLLFLGFLPTLIAAQTWPVELERAPLLVAPSLPAPSPSLAPPDPDHGSFTVEIAQPGLRKLQVRCPSGSFEGDGPTVAATAEGEACTVTALFVDRTRATAVLEAVVPGTHYLCFAAGGSTCRIAQGRDASPPTP
jgi:hypothetical protein